MFVLSLNNTKMEHIVEPTPDFDFSQLTCISPTSIAGGNYFIRLLQNPGQKPLYIQPPKCSTKQGIVKSGKKLYTDLLFKHEDEAFTEFLEFLETFCRSQIFQNKDKWFDSDLTENTIEDSFSPTAKIYKSGKLHSVRVNIPIRLGKCSLKIYDEDEKDIDIETIDSNSQVMTILEVQGIRCSARNFQIDMEVKQMMLLKPVDLFEKCIFAKPTSLAKPESSSIVVKEDSPEAIVETVVEVEKEMVEEREEEDVNGVEKMEEEAIDLDVLNESDVLGKPDEEKIEEVEEKPLAHSVLGLDEVDLDMPAEEEESMKLKKRDDVYYRMYKEAKRKARIARDFAIASYLEAKQIKHNFLEKSDISDDDEKMEEELETMENDMD